jgi:hypothetical protein
MALQLVLQETSLEAYATGSQVILRQRPSKSVRLTSTISGTVNDSLTGNCLGGASVVLREHNGNESRGSMRWCPTNEFGFYSLRRVPPGEYLLEVRSVGYHASEQPVVVASAEPLALDVALRHRAFPCRR